MPVIDNVLIDSKVKLNPSSPADSWFFTNCSINPYRGCQFDCSYCDGKAFYYNIPDFGTVIRSKNNFPKLLEKELLKLGYESQSSKKQSSLYSFVNYPAEKPKKKKFILSVGGGVTDCYQPLEKKREVMREIIKILIDFQIPSFFLTKSSLIERDIDLIGELSDQTYASVNFSIAHNDENVKRIHEPFAPSVNKRFETLEKFTSSGITGGVLAMPLLPFISDDNDTIENLVKTAKECNASYILTAGLTLKPGNREIFLNKIAEFYPELLEQYKRMFPENNTFRNPKINSKAENVMRKAHIYTTKYQLYPRIPRYVPEGCIEDNYRLSEHLWYIHYLRKWVLNEINSNLDKEFYRITRLFDNLSYPITSIAHDDLDSFFKNNSLQQYFQKIIFDFLESKDSFERKQLEKNL